MISNASTGIANAITSSSGSSRMKLIEGFLVGIILMDFVELNDCCLLLEASCLMEDVLGCWCAKSLDEDDGDALLYTADLLDDRLLSVEDIVIGIVLVEARPVMGDLSVGSALLEDCVVVCFPPEIILIVFVDDSPCSDDSFIDGCEPLLV